MTEYEQHIKGLHPYEDRMTDYEFIGCIECDELKCVLYNTDDGHTVDLETIMKRNPKEPKTLGFII